MFRRCITLVLMPSEIGTLQMKFLHKIIAVGFGKNGCGCYAGVQTITLNNAFKRNISLRFKTVAVNQKQFGFYRQLAYCLIHSMDGSVENINDIYLRMG